MGAEIAGRFISLGLPMGGRGWGSGVRFRIDQGIKGAEDTLDFLIAVGHLLLGKIVELQRLCQRADMFGPVIPRQRFGTGSLPGLNTLVTRRRQGPRVALASHNRADHAHPRHACHLTHHVVQVEMHLVERLWHMLHMLHRHLEQTGTMAHQTPELTEGRRRTKRRGSQPITMQPLQPSTIAASRFRASRDSLDVTSLDEGACKPTGCKKLKQGHPGHPRGCHDDRGDPTGRQPIGQPMQVTGKRAKFLDGLGIAIGGHTDPVLFSPDIDAGGMRVDDGHSLDSGRVRLALFRHTFLQSGAERGEPEKRGLLLRKDTRGGSALRGVRLFHLD